MGSDQRVERSSHGAAPDPSASAERGPRCVALATGGTAGHIHLALATARELQRRREDLEVLIIGATDGLEERIVPESGFSFAALKGSPYHGQGFAGKLRSLRNLGVGTLQARRLLKRHGVELAIGFGSYASLGTLLAARSLGIRTAIHEANFAMGLANRIAARFVDRIYLGHEELRTEADESRARVTGNPVRREISKLADKDHDDPEREPHERSAALRFLVMGGSLGSPFLNRRAPDLLARIAALGHTVEVVHVAGGADPAALRRRYRRAGITAFVTSYMSDISRAYQDADFAIATPGAVTLAELTFAGLPALLVPLSRAAEDHQRANAAAFVRSGGGLWVPEENWQPTELALRIVALLRNDAAHRMAARSTRDLARPDAARLLVEDCFELLDARPAPARRRTTPRPRLRPPSPAARDEDRTRSRHRISAAEEPRAPEPKTGWASLRSRVAGGTALLVLGSIALGQAVLADFVGIGLYDGYGPLQTAGVVIGPLLILAGGLVLADPRKRSRRRAVKEGRAASRR